MKALVYTGPNSLEIRNEPDPVAAGADVVVRVESVGICGSDMHAYHGYDSRRPAPLILGHEAAGRIMAGANDVGQRVTINPLVTCTTCDFCLDGRSHLCRERQILSMMPRPGAFAELVRVPARNLVVVPDSLSMDHAALTEPLAVAYHAVNLGLRSLARPASASKALVIGGGAIGLATALCLSLQGFRGVKVAEPHAGRRATVEKAGDFHAYAPGGKGEPVADSIDLVFDAVGAEATRKATSALVRPGGTIVHIGLLPGEAGFDVRKITLQEITVVGTYCYTMVEFREVVAALAAGQFGPLNWFETRPLSEGARAFQDLDGGKTDAAKIVLRP
jgi:2-desacetyl-2-hydroxyethyl bacteriochlorophyllide A dehydrogenase